MLTGRLLVAHLLRLMARRRRLLACWLLLLPLLSLALLPVDMGDQWLPGGCSPGQPQPPATPPDISTEQLWTRLQPEATDVRATSLWNDELEVQYQKVRVDPAFPLKVMLVPHSGRLDGDSRTPLAQLYRTAGRATLDTLVALMPGLPDMTFTWPEVSQLHLWWYSASETSRRTLSELVQSGRLEVTSGTWVQPEDASVRLHTIAQQLIEGHQWLQQHLGVTPETGLCSGHPAAGCSSVMPYLLSRAGLRQTIVTSTSRAWLEYLSAQRSVDFEWQQPWTFGGGDALLTHVHPADRPSDRADCDPGGDGPDPCPSVDLCESLLAADGYQDLFTGVTADNVKERAEALVAAAGRVASLSAHNVALVMVTADFHPANVSAWRERHRSLTELVSYIDRNGESLAASAELATPARYFSEVRRRAVRLPRLAGDLYGTPAPAAARTFRAARRLETRVRDTELLLVWALGVHLRSPPSEADRTLLQAARGLADARRTAALASRRGPPAGERELASAGRVLSRITHLLVSALLLDLGRFGSAAEAAKQYVSLDGGLGAAPHLPKITVQPGDTHRLVVYNALPYERSELVQLVTRTPNIAVQTSDGADVPVELSPRGRDAFTVRFLASRLSPVSMTTYSVSSADLDSSADPALTFAQTESDGGDEPLSISNDRLELRRTDSPHGWLLIDKRTEEQLPIQLRLVALRPAGTEVLACSESGWNRRDDTVTTEAWLRCGRLRLTLRLTRYAGALGRAVRLLVESDRDWQDKHGSASAAVDSGLFGSVLSWEGYEQDSDPDPVLLHVRTEISSGAQTDSIGGFFADSSDYQLSRRTAAALPGGLRPASTQAGLEDARWRLTLLLEQTRSVASPAEGELAVALGSGAETVYAELLLAAERLPTSPPLRDGQPPASSPLAAQLSQQLMSPATLLFGSSAGAVRLRTSPRLLSSALPCDYELVSLRQLSTGGDGRPASRALLTLRRRRLDCRLWQPGDELGCRLEHRLPVLSELLGAEAIRAVSLTGVDGAAAPPVLDGLQDIRLDVDQVQSFEITLDRQLPEEQPTSSTEAPKEATEPPQRRNGMFVNNGVRFEMGQSYELQV